jgi:hypothetical protein
MNEKNQVPSLLVSGIATTIQMAFPEEKLRIYWGPNQNNAYGYQDVTDWKDSIPLYIPQMVRFCFDLTPVSSSLVSPPPPPNTNRPVDWRLFDKFCTGGTFLNPTGCIDMPRSGEGTFGSRVNWQLFYTDTNELYTGAFISATCSGRISACRCHPDCINPTNFRYYIGTIYSYPCVQWNEFGQITSSNCAETGY